MNCFYRALVPSAMVCIAMFLQACSPAAISAIKSVVFLTTECALKIDVYMLPEKNNSIIGISQACAKLPIAQLDKCTEHGSILTDVAYSAIKLTDTGDCTKYILDLEKLKNSTAINISLIPGVVDVWVNAIKEQRVEYLTAVNTEIITLAVTPDLDIEDATRQILEYSGEDSKTSDVAVKEEMEEEDTEVEEVDQEEKDDAATVSGAGVALAGAAVATNEVAAAAGVATTEVADADVATPEVAAAADVATPEVITKFTMSGGNKIQAISTSHAGRWVASACSLLMVMAGVFRFSRRAWMTPSPTESETHGLVNGQFIEGESEHSAA